jgi:hypothetical protein
MRSIPSQIERDVARRLYEDAQRLDWIHLSMTARRRQYAAWLEAPEVGGALTQFLSREGARVWIKDGPMKEFARATAGVGRFASFVDQTGRGPAEMIRLALGAKWTLVAGSVGIKPLHCLAACEAEQRFLCWGPPKDFKHLLWAALTAAELEHHTARVLIVERVGQELRADERTRFELLCRRCSLEFSSVRVS